MELVEKNAIIAEIWKRRIKHREFGRSPHSEYGHEDDEILGIIDTLEVIDPYKQYIQYASIESGIKAHAEDYSFNIESELFQQLTEEQQKLWRKEIEQACISGGYTGYQLAKDPRYKEKLEVKEVDLELVTDWFDHIAQIADDRMTLTNQRMTDAHALDEIKCLAKNSSEFITNHYKAQKGE